MSVEYTLYAVEGAGAGAARSWTGTAAWTCSRRCSSCRASYPLAARDPRRFRVALTVARLPAPTPQFFYLLSGICCISFPLFFLFCGTSDGCWYVCRQLHKDGDCGLGCNFPVKVTLHGMFALRNFFLFFFFYNVEHSLDMFPFLNRPIPETLY